MKGVDTGVFPTKGKGWGVQGEAAFPDLLQHWNKHSRWESWRRGMALAFSPDAPLVDAIDVLAAHGLAGPTGRSAVGAIAVNPALKVDFPSRDSPQGAWSVVIRPRGTETAPVTLSDADQSETFWMIEGARLRVLQLKAPWVVNNQQLTPSLIGELMEDTFSGGKLLDVRDGHALLCIGADVNAGLLFFDASRLWRYHDAPGTGEVPGRILREEAVPPDAPLPKFKAGRSLTESMVLSCNCPRYLGAVTASLGYRAGIGTQRNFPQSGGQSLGYSGQTDQESPAGVKRRFAPMDVLRIPGHECKHAAAVRFLLRAPVSEPTDNPIIWPGDPLEFELEEMWKLDFDKKLAEELEAALSVRERWEGIDITLLALSAGDAFTVLPVRMRYDAPELEGNRSALDCDCLRRMFSAQQLFPEQHYSMNPNAATNPRLGDWWVGRGTAADALIYGPGGQVLESPAISRMGVTSISDHLLAGLP